ncbi:MAG: AAA family ATPase, partial [Spirochaetota bacterium]|nr:AAA family ATPase [Spirochaetota bacterium]
ISAFIKSLRGSDPDAALYWLARMVYAGEDPRFIFRRMLISASEDIGMADPYALTVVESAAAAFDRIGLPEGRYHLAHAAVYLATAPKSNSLMGFFDALSAVEQEQKAEIPPHLKDANRDSEGFGHGAGYLYPHAYRDHWVEQQYLPSSLQGKLFYQPSRQGREASIADDVSRRREAQLAASLFENNEEILTFSRTNQSRDRWIQRILDNRSASIEFIRRKIFEQLACARHHRICILGAEEGTLIWEALRRVPEGGVTGIIASSRADKIELLEHYSEQLEEIERPELWKGSPEEYLQEQPERAGTFEFVIGRNFTLRSSRKKEMLALAFPLLQTGGRLVLAESVPRKSQRLTAAVKVQTEKERGEASAGKSRSAELLGLLEQAENRLYSDTEHPLISWDVQDLLDAAEGAGFHAAAAELLTLSEERYIRTQDIDRWLTPGRNNPGIGDYLMDLAASGTVEELKTWLGETIGNTPVEWHSAVCILTAERE